MHREQTLCLALALVCIGSPLATPAAAPDPGLVIDTCHYPSDAAASAVWKPVPGSIVAASSVDGRQALRLSCQFASKSLDRASWDRAVNLDLASNRGIEFKVLCRDTSPVAYFSFYVQSGETWYHAGFYPESSTGWSTITIDKADLKAEGKSADLGQIKTIRISAWRSKAVNTEFYLSDLRLIPPPPAPNSRQAAEEALDRLGRFAGFSDYESATNQLGRDARVAQALAETDALRAGAKKLIAQKRFAEAIAQAAAAQQQLTRVYCSAQQSQPGEFRAFWCHNASGVKGIEWDEAIRRLATNGFTAILPNMLWGGLAFYDSKVLPVVAAERGDQIEKCLAACRKYGLQIHVWKVCWNLGHAAPPEFVEKLRSEQRLQATPAGKEELWLCPSHPENQQLEIAAMLEIVRNYDVDGVHFDYIRYPNHDRCFCAGCRERFQQVCGQTLTNWPGAVRANGALRQQWLEWRRGNITAVVKAVSEQARAIKPRIKLSAAVFNNWPIDRDSVAQDWKMWCDKGYLDFVCPMDYTSVSSQFDNMVARQMEWAGKVPCYPGIGVSAAARLTVDRAIDQINLTRRSHTGGFVIFNYGVNESEELVPLLGLGITRTR